MLTLCVFTYEASGLISNTGKKEKIKKNLLASGDCYFKSNYPASNDDNESSMSAYFEMKWNLCVLENLNSCKSCSK